MNEVGAGPGREKWNAEFICSAEGKVLSAEMENSALRTQDSGLSPTLAFLFLSAIFPLRVLDLVNDAKKS